MNKKSLILIVFIIAGLVFSGCAASNDEMMMSEVQYAKEAPMAMDMSDGDVYYGENEAITEETASGADNAVDYSEKIIYNVNMGLTVDDPVETSKDIKEKVSSMGGYVSSSYTNKGEGSYNYVNMQIRVPAKGLNDMTEYLYSIAEVDYENMYTDNITESYYDTVARLDHEKAQEEQLLELMDKADTIEDILRVRQELTYVQQNIEVYEGRIRMWDSLVDYSTIDLYISPTPTIANDNGLIRLITLNETGRAIVKALNNSLRFVANFFQRLLVIISALIIPAVIIVPIVLIVVRVVKKNKGKNKKNKDNNEM